MKANCLGYKDFDINCPVLSIPETPQYEFHLSMSYRFIGRIRFDAVMQNFSEGSP